MWSSKNFGHFGHRLAHDQLNAALEHDPRRHGGRSLAPWLSR
jgi:hypothetical protein